MIGFNLVWSGIKAKLTPEGALHTVVHNHPPPGEETSGVPFESDLLNPSDSADMIVAGTAAAPVKFSVFADADKDVYIKTLQVSIVDAGQSLGEFGNTGAALTNGCRICWETQDLGVVDIAGGALQTNWDFVKAARCQPSFGDGAGAFRAGNVVGTSEGYVPVFDMAYLFGLPWGLRLRAGSRDRLFIEIRDDLTAGTPVDEFSAQVSGMKI